VTELPGPVIPPAAAPAAPDSVRPRRGIGRRISRWLLRAAAIATGLGLLWLLAVWPPPIWYRWAWPRETAFMAMRRGQAELLAQHRQRRTEPRVDDALARRYHPVPLEEISPELPVAVLLAEDHRFLDHGGIDLQAIREAMGYRRQDFAWGDAADRAEIWRAIRRAWRNREAIRGASTITQQLAKNLYLSPSRNPFRKFKEAVTAYRLEWALGKHRILEIYVNVVELGPEIWGVEAASEEYFRRPAADLNATQAAALAATLPGPLSANPGYRPGRMRWRQQLVLDRMAREGRAMAARLKDADHVSASASTRP
jgi:monofunctional biosynthetic peptidoglycan transglycosylase